MEPEAGAPKQAAADFRTTSSSAAKRTPQAKTAKTAQKHRFLMVKILNITIIRRRFTGEIT
jgi:hypothetical protein